MGCLRSTAIARAPTSLSRQRSVSLVRHCTSWASQLAKQDIYFIFNAQHDCKGGECRLVETKVLQDREETSRKELTAKHSNFDRYLINLHAHHNAWRLRKVLPRVLTTPVPYTLDRKKLHTEAARELQKKNPAKRADAVAKAKATREQKVKDSQALKMGGEAAGGG